MRSAETRTLAALRRIGSNCANPNTRLQALLKNKHSTQAPTLKNIGDTTPNQALDANSDDKSLLAQYLLYRF